MSIKKQTVAKIAIDKSLLKEYANSNNERIVYMNDNSEFQIQLFNPYDFIIGAEIFINGDSLTNFIVLKPGQRAWIERYLNDPKKFKFSTYEVEDTKEVQEAIKNNGEIKIRLFKEEQHKRPIIHIADIDTYYGFGDYFTTTDVGSINMGNPGDAPYNSNVASYYSEKPINLKNCSAQTTLSNNIATMDAVKLSNDTMPFNDIYFSAETNTIETGRVEKGSYSNQKFKTVHYDFCDYSFKTEIIKILPTSQKQYNENDLQKIYCTNCGRKLNPKFKYCPYCGEKCI